MLACEQFEWDGFARAASSGRFMPSAPPLASAALSFAFKSEHILPSERERAANFSVSLQQHGS